MQFTQESIDKILAGEKDQTRRPVKPGDTAYFDDDTNSYVVFRNGRLKWKVGKIYAVCPGRGKHQVARIRILDVSREDVRRISAEDAMAEGFETRSDFFIVWCSFYDPQGIWTWEDRAAYIPLESRPSHLYDAWALVFELVV